MITWVAASVATARVQAYPSARRSRPAAERLAAAEQHRRDRQAQFVDEPALQVLTDHGRAAARASVIQSDR
jgi:hypothetical protein